MSDKRRRRRRASGGSSEEDDDESLSGSDHEYESAADDSAQEESEVLDLPTDDEKPDKVEDQDAVDGDNEEDDGRDDDDPEDHSDQEDEEKVLTEEREAGDGQEENKKVDDDEDRRNPQYIPKKGMFYEHDSRLDTDEEEEKAKEDAAKPARIPRSENVERWGHDKFLEREQQPKTREELVNVYGYDIRNEDSAPRARRRRRYGRGPNKYTRNWEDEQAYEPRNGPKSEGDKAGSKSKRGGGADKSRDFKEPRKSDLEEFPPLEQKNNGKSIISNKQTDNSTSKSSRGGSSVLASSRGGRGSSGRGGGRGAGGRGGGNSERASAQQQPADGKKQRPKSEYSANQRLQKEPKPVVQNAHHKSQDGGKMDRLEKDFSAKTKLDDKKRGGQAKDSPRTNRRVHDSEDNSKPKRYSNSRRGGGNSGNGNARHQQDYYEYNDQQQQDSPQQQPSRYMNGSASNVAVSNVPSNFVNTFPNSGSGPPPAAPFIAANTVATPPTSTSGFLDPAAIVNYGPPVQFTPVAVPVTVTVPLVSVPGGAAGAPLDTLSVLHPPLGTPTVTSPDQVLLAAAAAGAAGQGYAEVRGGVTYFNPTAQAPVMARPVNKRPKAAIPIVDPSQLGSAMSPGSVVASDSFDESLDQQPTASGTVMVAKT